MQSLLPSLRPRILQETLRYPLPGEIRVNKKATDPGSIPAEPVHQPAGNGLWFFQTEAGACSSLHPQLAFSMLNDPIGLIVDQLLVDRPGISPARLQFPRKYNRAALMARADFSISSVSREYLLRWLFLSKNSSVTN